MCFQMWYFCSSCYMPLYCYVYVAYTIYSIYIGHHLHALTIMRIPPLLLLECKLYVCTFSTQYLHHRHLLHLWTPWMNTTLRMRYMTMPSHIMIITCSHQGMMTSRITSRTQNSHHHAMMTSLGSTIQFWIRSPPKTCDTPNTRVW